MVSAPCVVVCTDYVTVSEVIAVISAMWNPGYEPLVVVGTNG